MEQFFLALVGFSGGFIVAGGVVALMVGLGIITRFIGISRTAKHIRGVRGRWHDCHSLFLSVSGRGVGACSCRTVYGYLCGRLDHGVGRGRERFSGLLPQTRHHEGDELDCDHAGSR